MATYWPTLLFLLGGWKKNINISTEGSGTTTMIPKTGSPVWCEGVGGVGENY